jgi:hypothetical protein
MEGRKHDASSDFVTFRYACLARHFTYSFSPALITQLSPSNRTPETILMLPGLKLRAGSSILGKENLTIFIGAAGVVAPAVRISWWGW